MSREKIVSAAMSLRAISPELWDQFLHAMRQHSAETTQAMARCDPAMLLRAQGMAIAMQELVQTLQEAPTLHEHIGKTHYGQERNRNS